MAPGARGSEHRDMSTSLWDHPDWYDLHQSVAGVEREPEHYREAIVALVGSVLMPSATAS
jgi:hypothetical protein